VSAAISRTIAADFLIPVVTVEGCYPIIVTGDFSDHIRGLRTHTLDLAIGETEPIHAARDGLEMVTIHRPTLVAVENVPLLSYPASSAYQWEIDAFLDEHLYRPTPVAEMDDAFFMLEAVAATGAVAFVPRTVARDAIRLGRVKVLESLNPSSAGVFAFYHRNEKSALVRATVQKLAEHARTHLDAGDTGEIGSGPRGAIARSGE
jgi:DNA-binding transcriptional LysR family regulator